MKARTPYQPGKKQKQLIAEYVERQSGKALVRVQYLFLIAMHEEFGIGIDRANRFFRRYEELIGEYDVWKQDDVADEKLDRAIKQIMGKDFETGLMER